MSARRLVFCILVGLRAWALMVVYVGQVPARRLVVSCKYVMVDGIRVPLKNVRIVSILPNGDQVVKRLVYSNASLNNSAVHARDLKKMWDGRKDAMSGNPAGWIGNPTRIQIVDDKGIPLKDGHFHEFDPRKISGRRGSRTCQNPDIGDRIAAWNAYIGHPGLEGILTAGVTYGPGLGNMQSVRNNTGLRERNVAFSAAVSDSPQELAVLANYKIGDVGPGGGIIFSIESGTYLEAAPQDIGKFIWQDALSEVRNYSHGGCNDWYLPPKGELNEMYENRDLVGGFSSNYYWSSSEVDAGHTWIQGFANGSQYGSLKNLTGYVRPVRAFSISGANLSGKPSSLPDEVLAKLANDIIDDGGVKTSPVVPVAEAYKIGDTGPGGGIIFSIKSGTYLEAAPQDIGKFVWQDALSEVRNYSHGGCNDWYLPPKGELNEMYENRTLIGGFSSDYYWSSSDYDDAYYAWFQDFGGGQIGNRKKYFSHLPHNPDSAFYVRPVRAFSISGANLSGKPSSLPDEVLAKLANDFIDDGGVKTSPVVPAVKAYKIGDTGPGGGIIFSIKSGTYLEAAPKDIGKHDWQVALSQAGNYSHGGCNDWRLPSKDELSAMYEKRDLIGGFSTDYYWSSSEYDFGTAWYQNFLNGNQTLNSKILPTYYVRPVRAFSI